MTRSAGNRLPEELLAILDGSDPEEPAGFTIVLSTPGPGGWPLVALLSLGEVMAAGPRDVRLALWTSTSTTAELTRDGLTTMSMVHGGAAWDTRLRCERADDIVVDGGGRIAAFRCVVEEVLEDRVGYAELVNGIRFRLRQPDQVLPRWKRILEGLQAIEGHSAAR
jgi:hypothetical protein